MTCNKRLIKLGVFYEHRISFLDSHAVVACDWCLRFLAGGE